MNDIAVCGPFYSRKNETFSVVTLAREEELEEGRRFSGTFFVAILSIVPKELFWSVVSEPK